MRKKLENKTFREKEVFYLSDGSYSDYRIIAHFYTIKECDLYSLIREYAAVDDGTTLTRFQHRGTTELNAWKFAEWLAKSGYFEEMRCYELNPDWEDISEILRNE